MQGFRSSVALGALFFALTTSREADALSGFYVGSSAGSRVGGGDAALTNHTTHVALMREGTRTVVAMQNDYEGPLENFALVIPVPTAIEKESVKTLPRALFTHLEQLTAPRLVEQWEQDPCGHHQVSKNAYPTPKPPTPKPADPIVNFGVNVDAKFAVGEYEVVVLTAKDADGLEAWLRDAKYKLPENAAAFLKPYVERGSKFFVAKVDVKKVKMEGGRALLSPIRFHYDSDKLTLPVRLGLINADAKRPQDVVVHVLAKGTRYEAANAPNAAVPTNIEVKEGAKATVAPFYVSLFEKTLEKNPGAVVTEYAWDASSCDPCTSAPLTPSELSTLGANVVPSAGGPEAGGVISRSGPGGMKTKFYPSGYVVTRLHARIGKDVSFDDLELRPAQPLTGGREFASARGQLEPTVIGGSINNFQARYVLRHAWEGAITCTDPQRGNWGGQKGGPALAPMPAMNVGSAVATSALESFLPSALPEKSFLALAPTKPAPATPLPAAPVVTADPTPVAPSDADAGAPLPGITPPAVERGGCGCSQVPSEEPKRLLGSGALAVLGLALLRAVRRVPDRRRSTRRQNRSKFDRR